MRKKVLYLLVLFIFSNSVVYKITDINEKQRIDTVLKSINKNLQSHYEIQLYHQKKTAQAAYDSLRKNKKAIQILKQAKDATKQEQVILRKQLYDLLIEEYKTLTIKGILQYQFNLQNNKTFLRLHKPKKFDDDLSLIRYSYTYVNKHKKPIRGLEQGKTTHGFRNVFPVFDYEGNYLCAMEISFSSELIQKMLNKVSKIHTHFIVNKDIVKVRSWKRDDFIIPYEQSKENKNYLVSKVTDKELNQHDDDFNPFIEQKADFINKSMDKAKPFNFYNLKNDQTYIISFYPIQNIKDRKVIAWLVAYENNTFINDTLKNSFYIRVFTFVIFTIMFYFIYQTIRQKKFTDKELEKKTKELKDINENLEQKVLIEIEKNKKTQKQLFKSEKLASMGEMIGNIAHQWRQPLSVISTASTGILFQKQYGTLEDKLLYENCKLIDENAQYLSRTIDDFKNFIKGNRVLKTFNLKDTIESFLHLVEPSIKEHSIKIILDVDKSLILKGYPNELIQCFMNIFNNSKDVLKDIDLNKNDRYIFISTKKQNNKIIIKIKDNGSGIKDKIIAKIFEPYFTTKHKSQGTGLGLHMTYNLIVNGMDGNIEVKNINFNYDNKDYNGAEFTITLPKLD